MKPFALVVPVQPTGDLLKKWHDIIDQYYHRVLNSYKQQRERLERERDGDKDDKQRKRDEILRDAEERVKRVRRQITKVKGKSERSWWGRSTNPGRSFVSSLPALISKEDDPIAEIESCELLLRKAVRSISTFCNKFPEFDDFLKLSAGIAAGVAIIVAIIGAIIAASFSHFLDWIGIIVFLASIIYVVAWFGFRSLWFAKFREDWGTLLMVETFIEGDTQQHIMSAFERVEDKLNRDYEQWEEKREDHLRDELRRYGEKNLHPIETQFIQIDPANISENFRAFLSLDEYGELLGTGRVLMGDQGIAQELRTLADNVRQTLQRTRGMSENDERRRILIWVGFPEGLTPEATNDFFTLARFGAACGIFMILVLDQDRLKEDFDSQKIEEFEKNATVVAWDGKTFVWQGINDSNSQACRLTLDPPPEKNLFQDLLRLVHQRVSQSITIERNPYLRKVLEGTVRVSGQEAKIWPGQPVDTKKPLETSFLPRGSSNLLIVGQPEETAIALLTADFCTLDLNLQSQYDPLQLLHTAFPSSVIKRYEMQGVGKPSLSRLITELHDEMKDREEPGAVWSEPLYLLIHGFQQAQSLLQSNTSNGHQNLAKLENLFRSGPRVGIYTLMWCERLSDLGERALENFQRRMSCKLLYQKKNWNS